MIYRLTYNIRCSFYKEAEQASFFCSFNGLLRAAFQAEGGTQLPSSHNQTWTTKGNPQHSSPGAHGLHKTSQDLHPDPQLFQAWGCLSTLLPP